MKLKAMCLKLEYDCSSLQKQEVENAIDKVWINISLILLCFFNFPTKRAGLYRII